MLQAGLCTWWHVCALQSQMEQKMIMLKAADKDCCQALEGHVHLHVMGLDCCHSCKCCEVIAGRASRAAATACSPG